MEIELTESADLDKILLLSNILYEVSNDLCVELQNHPDYARLGEQLAILCADLYTDVELPILKQNPHLSERRHRPRHGPLPPSVD